MESKMVDPDFLEDMDSLIRPEEAYNIEEAYQVVKEKIIDRLMK